VIRTAHIERERERKRERERDMNVSIPSRYTYRRKEEVEGAAANVARLIVESAMELDHEVEVNGERERGNV
jgi:hypothetical protein